MTTPYPAGLGELAFVQSYYRSTLRKPQVVADALLRAAVMAGQDDRLLVAGSIAGELSEACRHLVLVYEALNDRRYPIARSLLGPLPGAGAWRAFANRAGSTPPEAMLRDLGIGEDAMESAERLRGQADLAWVTPLIRAAETGDVRLLFPQADQARPDTAVWAGAPDGEGEGAIVVQEDDAATLADMTADMVSIARGFLGSYLRARLGAGKVV